MEKRNGFRKKKFAELSLLLLLLGAACQPAITPIPYATPAVLAVQSTPALQPLAEMYRACVEELENTGLVLLDAHASQLDLQQAALALRWGPDSAFQDSAYVIGQEELVLVVHPQNALASLSHADLRAIYLGALRDWPQANPPVEIQPWVYLKGDDAQAIFDTVILAGQKPSERVVSLAPDPAAMREAVAASPAAIGFLPRRWVDASVKPITVEGLDPAALTQPILALSRAQPTGLEKAWLLCLQDRLSQ